MRPFVSVFYHSAQCVEGSFSSIPYAFVMSSPLLHSTRCFISILSDFYFDLDLK